MNKEEILHNIVFDFICVSRKHKKLMVNSLNKTGVFESQHRLLMIISEHNDFSQKQLADKMEISTAAVAVSLKKLEKGGYIERITNSTDNRYNDIKITTKGQKVVEESKKIFRTVDAAMFLNFSDEELKEFSKLINRIGNNLDI